MYYKKRKIATGKGILQTIIKLITSPEARAIASAAIKGIVPVITNLVTNKISPPEKKGKSYDTKQLKKIFKGTSISFTT